MFPENLRKEMGPVSEEIMRNIIKKGYLKEVLSSNGKIIVTLLNR
jgi:hypothetical protein